MDLRPPKMGMVSLEGAQVPGADRGFCAALGLPVLDAPVRSRSLPRLDDFGVGCVDLIIIPFI